MAETTYYKDKLYLPHEVRDRLGLVNGDILHIEVVGEGAAKLSAMRGRRATEKILEKLDDPPDLEAVEGKLSREEVYEDIT
jgi:bifunctional DNA-binding transcriptional regulator/antitoxin component of YhaV-PrlF toxin-antitoxin module